MTLATSSARSLRPALIKRRAVAVVALLLVVRLLLPCFPAQAGTGGDDAFYILCTPNGFVDLRSLYPQEDGFAPQTQEERQQPTPADGNVFQACSGFCGLSVPLLAAEPAFASRPLLAGLQRLAVRDSENLPTFERGYDLAARAPPAFPS
ncbi:hypothetical protein HBA54_05115 [Pelagibius litoralis]|uniref:DUF2946 family protein n=1 Tax=Pelagibius litoralis TaxID=374515 RepID=A0A967C1T1_9PROT|nr:hypothetical protein [Pelagibius litoralis]NIA67966.1 hypothetical protein [Pelagibius litoralis]